MDNDAKISEINQRIRNFINDSIVKETNIFSKRQDGYWSQFFSALDTIDDTCVAIDKFGKNKGDYFNQNPYLSIYGLLQALFLQQDATRHLKQAILGKDINFKKEYPKLFEIRQLRNETIGHPTKKENDRGKSNYRNNEVAYCTIDRSSLSNEGFGYMLWMNLKTDHKHIKFREIIDFQEDNLGIELSKILNEIEKEEMNHMEKFKNEKLANYLSKKTLYEVNLIYGVRWDDNLAWPSFDYYFKQYKMIRSGLEARYGQFGTSLRIPGTAEVIKKLDYVFSKLDIFKNTKKFDEYEFEVYVDALDAGLKELGEHLILTDKEFEI